MTGKARRQQRARARAASKRWPYERAAQYMFIQAQGRTQRAGQFFAGPLYLGGPLTKVQKKWEAKVLGIVDVDGVPTVVDLNLRGIQGKARRRARARMHRAGRVSR